MTNPSLQIYKLAQLTVTRINYNSCLNFHYKACYFKPPALPRPALVRPCVLK